MGKRKTREKLKHFYRDLAYMESALKNGAPIDRQALLAIQDFWLRFRVQYTRAQLVRDQNTGVLKTIYREKGIMRRFSVKLNDVILLYNNSLELKFFNYSMVHKEPWWKVKKEEVEKRSWIERLLRS